MAGKGGKASRIKGDRMERELRDRLRDWVAEQCMEPRPDPCTAEQASEEAEHLVRRVPSSGAGADFKQDLLTGEGEDVLRWEVKGRKHGFTEVYRWLEPADVLAYRATLPPGSPPGTAAPEWLITLRLKDLLAMIERGCL